MSSVYIIIALGGLEIALWRADHKRQAEQLATLEAIWVELALLNEEKPPVHSRQAPEVSPVRVDLPLTASQTPTVIAQ